MKAGTDDYVIKDNLNENRNHQALDTRQDHSLFIPDSRL